MKPDTAQVYLRRSRVSVSIPVVAERRHQGWLIGITNIQGEILNERKIQFVTDYYYYYYYYYY